MKNRSTSLLATLALTLAVAGCSSIGNRKQAQYLVLETPAASAPQPAATAQPRPAVLLIAPVTATNFYDSDDIAYSTSRGTRAYYQYSSWAARPGRRIARLLLERLDRSQAFQTVALATAGVTGQYVINAHLDELYHDATSAPGTAHVRLTVELVDPLRRALLGRRTFTGSAPVASFNAEGAVDAMGQALGGVLDDVAVWADQETPR